MSPARLLGIGVALVLAWRGVSSAVNLVRELARHPSEEWSAALFSTEDERIFAALARRDQAAGLPEGYHREFFLALRERVPAGGRVFFLQDRSHRAANLGQRMHVLLYPRFIRRASPSRPLVGELDEATFAVTFDEASAGRLDGVASPIQHGSDWVLWQCRSSP